MELFLVEGELPYELVGTLGPENWLDESDLEIIRNREEIPGDSRKL